MAVWLQENRCFLDLRVLAQSLTPVVVVVVVAVARCVVCGCCGGQSYGCCGGGGREAGAENSKKQ